MGGQDNGLTLEGIAQRLEALERENAQLRHKVATMEGSGARRDEVVALRGSDRSPDKEVASEFAGEVSRRSLLSKAGAAAVAAVAAGTLLSTREAKATHLNGPIQVDSVLTHSVSAHAENGDSAVKAYTISDTNPAVEALNAGTSPAVKSSNEGTGVGVEGYSFKGVGVSGIGYGLKGVGVLGEGRHGVYGKANPVGYGGLFEGGKSQLRIVPADSVGSPTSDAHSKGEIYMDSAATLYVCTRSGTPGTWKKVTTTTA